MSTIPDEPLNLVKEGDPSEPPGKEYVWCRWFRGGHWSLPVDMKSLDGYNFVGTRKTKHGLCNAHALVDGDDILEIRDALKGGDLDFRSLFGGKGNEEKDGEGPAGSGR